MYGQRFVYIHTYVLLTYLDGIILGMSSLQQLTANLDACEEGPLTQGKLKYMSVIVVKSR